MQEGKAGRALALKRSEEAHQAKEKEEKPKSDAVAREAESEV